MGYTKNSPVWAPGGAPGISYDRLNHMEEQYDEAHAEIEKFFNEDTGFTDLNYVSPYNAALAAQTWDTVLDISGGGPYWFLGGSLGTDHSAVNKTRYTINGVGPFEPSAGAGFQWMPGSGNAFVFIPIYAATSLKIEIWNNDGANPHGYSGRLIYRT